MTRDITVHQKQRVLVTFRNKPGTITVKGGAGTSTPHEDGDPLKFRLNGSASGDTAFTVDGDFSAGAAENQP